MIFLIGINNKNSPLIYFKWYWVFVFRINDWLFYFQATCFCYYAFSASFLRLSAINCCILTLKLCFSSLSRMRTLSWLSPKMLVPFSHLHMACKLCFWIGQDALCWACSFLAYFFETVARSSKELAQVGIVFSNRASFFTTTYLLKNCFSGLYFVNILFRTKNKDYYFSFSEDIFRVFDKIILTLSNSPKSNW